MSTEAERRKIVEQTDAIHRLSGFDTEDSPQWFKALTEDFIKGKVTAAEASKIGHERLKKGDF